MGQARAAGSYLDKSECIKGKIQILVFFYSQGVIYTNHVPTGATVIGVDIRTELCRFVKFLKLKKPDMAAGDLYIPEASLKSSPPPLCSTFSRR
jgi:hypothetical protein